MRSTAPPAAEPAPDLALLTGYVQQVLGTSITPLEVPRTANLPYLLAEQYRVLKFELVGRDCLALWPRTRELVTPAQVRKHLDLAARQTEALCILVTNELSSAARARLIAQHIPFIVPGNQLYLPDLGLDLREHFRRLRQKPDTLGPAAQAVLVYALLRLRESTVTPQALSRALGYSAMTLTRVADELEDSDLVTAKRSGRNRLIDFGEDKRALWQRAMPVLRTPVARTEWVVMPPASGLRDMPLAGLSALAASTLLAAPDKVCVAAAKDDWTTLGRHGIKPVPYEEMADAQVQVWRYDPTLLAEEGAVDPLSLYLSLRDDDDDRVVAALEAHMRSVAWW